MNRIIILIIVGIFLYVIGNKIYSNISEKILQKQDLHKIESKIDSIYLEYQKIYDILAFERDSIEVRIVENITNIYQIRNEVDTPTNMASDEILEELKRLVIDENKL